MLYFAYGSNMAWDHMRDRCASVLFVGIAVFPDHKLAFTRKSVTRNCGVADAVAEAGQKMWGVVYEISALDVGKLDLSEGFRPGREKNSYSRHEIMVFIDGDNKRPLTVSVYFADAERNPPLPNAEYKDLILSGARHWHLPAEYIHQLEEIKVTE